jgi:hypothetical protein
MQFRKARHTTEEFGHVQGRPACFFVEGHVSFSGAGWQHFDQPGAAVGGVLNGVRRFPVKCLRSKILQRVGAVVVC